MLLYRSSVITFLFFFSVPPPTEISTLSLHDALPICRRGRAGPRPRRHPSEAGSLGIPAGRDDPPLQKRRGGSRSEEHTSELQSLTNLVCRLLLEKKKKKKNKKIEDITLAIR